MSDARRTPSALGDSDIAVVSFAVGSTLLVFTCATLVISAGLLSFGVPLSWVSLATAASVSAIYGGWISGRSRPDRRRRVIGFGLVMLAVVTVCGACAYASGAFYDLSFDGQIYHQEAIIRLKEGWNPYTEPTRFADGPVLTWVNHYAKGSWINAAALYVVTNQIEYSKGFNLLLIVVAFCLAVAALDRVTGLSRGHAVLLALVAALNPVSVYQSLSFYLDGQMASLLAILAALSFLWLVAADRVALLACVATLVMMVNVKFTRLVYALVAAAGVAVCAATIARRALAVTTGAMAAGLLAGVLFVGYNPYVTNTVHHGHVFYPLNVVSVGMLAANMPTDFEPRHRFGRLFHSLFSESASAPMLSRLKPPFTVRRAELLAFHAPDVRVGGFGPLFGGALLLGAVIVAAAWRRQPHRVYAVLGMLLWILVSAVINPGAWWARYVPQLWLLPIVTLALGLSAPRARLVRYASYGLAAILLINVALVTIPYMVHQTGATRVVRRQLMELVGRNDPALISVEFFMSNRIRLREAGVDYREIDRARCVDYVTLPASTTRICAGTARPPAAAGEGRS